MGKVSYYRLLLGLGSVIGKGLPLLSRVERAIWVCWVSRIIRSRLSSYARSRQSDYQEY